MWHIFPFTMKFGLVTTFYKYKIRKSFEDSTDVKKIEEYQVFSTNEENLNAILLKFEKASSQVEMLKNWNISPWFIYFVNVSKIAILLVAFLILVILLVVFVQPNKHPLSDTKNFSKIAIDEELPISTDTNSSEIFWAMEQEENEPFPEQESTTKIWTNNSRIATIGIPRLANSTPSLPTPRATTSVPRNNICPSGVDDFPHQDDEVCNAGIPWGNFSAGFELQYINCGTKKFFPLDVYSLNIFPRFNLTFTNGNLKVTSLAIYGESICDEEVKGNQLQLTLDWSWPKLETLTFINVTQDCPTLFNIIGSWEMPNLKTVVFRNSFLSYSNSVLVKKILKKRDDNIKVLQMEVLSQCQKCPVFERSLIFPKMYKCTLIFRNPNSPIALSQTDQLLDIAPCLTSLEINAEFPDSQAKIEEIAERQSVLEDLKFRVVLNESDSADQFMTILRSLPKFKFLENVTLEVKFRDNIKSSTFNNGQNQVTIDLTNFLWLKENSMLKGIRIKSISDVSLEVKVPRHWCRKKLSSDEFSWTCERY